MQERRQHYRVQAQFTEAIDIQVRMKGATMPTCAKDLSAGGIGILLPIEQGKAFEIAEFVSLTFEAPWARKLKIKGKILRKKVFEETQIEIGIAFTEWEERRDSLDHRLKRIFNERRVHRVITPVFETPHGLVSLGTGETERLRIEEIGVFGARLASRTESLIAIDQVGSLSMDFGRGSVALPCKVRHIQHNRDDPYPTVGIHFHTLESMDKKFENTLIDYIFVLQRNEMQGPK